MKSIIFLFSFLYSSSLIYGQELKPDHYFDFWVGKWNVSWKEPDGNVGKGTNIVLKTLDDQVIEENFKITSVNQKGFKGKSLSVYQPQSDVWRQTWIDNQGDYYNFTGKIDGDKRIFETQTPKRKDGTMFKQRMVFHHITKTPLDGIGKAQ
ncbi:DUF1579 family protein [Mesohalobacter halotolerans]|uniref:DUF1579 domain-containing protein n=1 Tax=Mesohalobacter halotolerans TaxID=1883405 RepID=A0A4U5TRW7_9FLAO|nr:DUF1579 family protein [Mesohalobacter halotolerans]MBS3738319.1 DUF1579 family protein [Psychroflexus sp.]TKS56856.1 DUF1579 domain-containing protein [Mesohalobacter halotolerans]